MSINTYILIRQSLFIITTRSFSLNNSFPNSKRWIASLKSRIRQSQTKSALSINSALIELYWSIGADIVDRQAEAVWGSGIFNQISRDIRAEFPDIKGFSKSNLYYMKQFYLFYSQGDAIVQQPVGQLASPDSEGNLHKVGAKIVPQTDNPPAIFHQLGGKLPALLVSIPWRHHVEIMTHCKTVKEAVFYIQKTIENGWSRAMLMNCSDLLFYHLELRCYVVIELKAGEFEAEHTGKLGLYVSAINHYQSRR